MRKLVPAVAAALALSLAAPAAAITNGVPDEGRHPYVGQLFLYVPDATDPDFDDPGTWFRCSGTLLTSRIVLTAGHCTFAVGLDGSSTTDGGDGTGGNDVWINFREAPDYSDMPPDGAYAPGRNEERYEDRVAWLQREPDWHRGTAFTHPRYVDALFFHHDLGVVVLDEPIRMPAYGELPEVRYLNRFVRMEKSKRRFTPVGYGLEKVLPGREEGGDTRRRATVKLNTLHGTGDAPRGSFASFSNSIGTVHRGGTCFGDSGGPILDAGTRVVVAVTSFASSPNCTGVGGGYRVDQPDDLRWLAEDFGLAP